MLCRRRNFIGILQNCKIFQKFHWIDQLSLDFQALLEYICNHVLRPGFILCCKDCKKPILQNCLRQAKSYFACGGPADACSNFCSVAMVFWWQKFTLVAVLSSNHPWQEQFVCQLTDGIVHRCRWGAAGLQVSVRITPKFELMGGKLKSFYCVSCGVCGMRDRSCAVKSY